MFHRMLPFTNIHLQKKRNKEGLENRGYLREISTLLESTCIKSVSGGQGSGKDFESEEEINLRSADYGRRGGE